MNPEPLDVTRLDDPVYVATAMEKGLIARLSPAQVSALYEPEIQKAMRFSLKAQHERATRIIDQGVEQSRRQLTAVSVLSALVLALTAANLAF